MFVHTSNLTSRTLRARLTKPYPRPMLLTGLAGTSKTTSVKAFIAEQNCTTKTFKPFISNEAAPTCNCPACTKIAQDKSVDVLTLFGQEKVEEVRTKVGEFWHHTPKEFNSRYLIIRQAGLHTKDTLDTLLKLLEEPPAYLQIFVTSSNADALPPAIKSRCQHIQQPKLTPELLNVIVRNTPSLSAAVRSLDKHTFTSTRQVAAFQRLDLERAFKLLSLDQTTPASIELHARKLWEQTELDPDFPAPEARTFVLDYFIDKWNWHIRVNSDATPELPKLELLLLYLRTTLNETLFRHIGNPRAGQFMNLENQFVGFFLALHAARRMVGIP